MHETFFPDPRGASSDDALSERRQSVTVRVTTTPATATTTTTTTTKSSERYRPGSDDEVVGNDAARPRAGPSDGCRPSVVVVIVAVVVFVVVSSLHSASISK